GAAYLAGLAEGGWESMSDIGRRWVTDVVVEPSPIGSPQRVAAESLHSQWLRAVERSRNWAAH
ncbi:MAG: glycerol kinase, partial [Ilumatobacteraceae bacterium]